MHLNHIYGWILVSALAAITLADGALAAPKRPACDLELVEFRQVIDLGTPGTFKNRSRVAFTAKRACAPRIGMPWDLEQVETVIEKNGAVWGRFYSPSGIFDQKSRELYLTGTRGPSQMAPVHLARSMWVDLRRRIVRSPGLLVSLEPDRKD